jgi:hypothetical protein
VAVAAVLVVQIMALAAVAVLAAAAAAVVPVILLLVVVAVLMPVLDQAEAMAVQDALAAGVVVVPESAAVFLWEIMPLLLSVMGSRYREMQQPGERGQVEMRHAALFVTQRQGKDMQMIYFYFNKPN